jgi:hypothetical protein
MKRLIPIILACFALSSAILSAQDGDPASVGPEVAAEAGSGGIIGTRLQFRTGLSWQGQGANTTADVSSGEYPNGISASQWLNYVGFAYQFHFSPVLGFSPSIDLYTDEYVYLEEYGQAFITQSQTGSGLGPLATVLGIQLNLPWMMYAPISETARFELSAGLALNFRIPVIPLDGSEDIGLIGSYTMGEGRFINLYLEPGFSFMMTDWFGFSLSARTVVPVWHLWDSTDLPIWDSMFAGLGLSLILEI